MTTKSARKRGDTVQELPTPTGGGSHREDQESLSPPVPEVQEEEFSVEEPRSLHASAGSPVQPQVQLQQYSAEFMRRAAFLSYAQSLAALVEALGQDTTGSALVARAKGMSTPLLKVVLAIVSE